MGGYCNPAVDALSARVLVDNDPATRLKLIEQFYKITTDEITYVPLHQQGLAWSVSSEVELAQHADNQLMLYYVKK